MSNCLNCCGACGSACPGQPVVVAEAQTGRQGVDHGERTGRGRAHVGRDDGEAEAALVSFEDAADYAERYCTADQRFAAHWATGRALRDLGRVEEALRLQERLYADRPGEKAVEEELALLRAIVAHREAGSAGETSDEAHTIES